MDSLNLVKVKRFCPCRTPQLTSTFQKMKKRKWKGNVNGENLRRRDWEMRLREKESRRQDGGEKKEASMRSQGGGDEERPLSANVSDLRTKLFKAGRAENENRGKIMKLEKEVKNKDDKIKELEHEVTRLEAENDGACYQIFQLEHKVEIQKARAHGKPLPSASILDGWILAVRERLASKKGTLLPDDSIT